jgi:hypothetical protein
MPDDENSEDQFDEIEILKIAREEAHRTIDKQVDTLDDIDNKAAQILRLNLLLLSIILTGFSIIASDDGLNSMTADGGVVNLFLICGIISIIASTTVAAFTYTVSNKKSGMSGRDIADILESDYSPEKDLKDIVEGYSVWMQMNFKMNTINAPLGTTVLLLLIYGIILLTVGVYHAFINQVAWYVTLAVLVVLGLITWRSGIISQIKRYNKYRDFDPAKD